eukprot:scaffold37385_cov44-Phaeocystis_antarctica.AAC.5
MTMTRSRSSRTPWPSATRWPPRCAPPSPRSSISGSMAPTVLDHRWAGGGHGAAQHHDHRNPDPSPRPRTPNS